MLLGTFLGAALPAAPFGTDAALWENAARLAQASRWFFPGRAVIDSRDTQGKTVTHSRITTSLKADPRGEPSLQVGEVHVDDQDRTRDLAEEVASELSPMVESLYRSDHPLHFCTPSDTAYVGEMMIEGARCRGFRTRTVLDGVTIESTTWIDADRAFARRTDTRGLNLPLNKDGATLREMTSRTDYAFDSQGRWLLVRHTEHTDLTAQALFSTVALQSDKTITCGEHWEYRGPRRTRAAAPPQPVGTHSLTAPRQP